MDKMIDTSKEEENHVQILKKLFDILNKYKLKLNPIKFTFGVRYGKLLGFVVNNQGIKVNLNKVKAIQALPTPRTKKGVRSLLRRLNYIARFIS